MPISDKQLQANRRNASRSTGPRTDAGKQISRRNALTHGIRATDLVGVTHDDETPEELEDLLDRLRADLAPEGILEEMLVSQIAFQHWRLRRVFRAKSAEIQTARDEATRAIDQADDPTPHLAELAAAADIPLYGKAIGDGARRRLTGSPQGLAYILAVLERAAADLEQTGSLTPTLTHVLEHLLGPNAELIRLLHSLQPPPATPESGQKPTTNNQELTINNQQLTTNNQELTTKTALLSSLARHQQEISSRLAVLKRQRSADLATLLARHSLPLPDAADKILRYEKTIQNQLSRSLSELHRLQQARSAPTQGAKS